MAPNTCDAMGAFCLSHGATGAERGAKALFMLIVFVCLCAIVSSILHKGKRAQTKAFATYTLTGLVLIQYYHVYRAELFGFPFSTGSAFWGNSYTGASKKADGFKYRHACLESSKGGKARRMETRDLGKNPCFCDTLNAQDLTGHDEIICSDKEYLSDERDCHHGQRQFCSKQEPCTPCELSRAIEFLNASNLMFLETRSVAEPLSTPRPQWSRCTSCGPQNRGDCHFVPGVGPYCFQSPNSRAVVPCQQCCTEAPSTSNMLLFNGQCV